MSGVYQMTKIAKQQETADSFKENVSKIYIDEVHGKGRGVFAARLITSGEIIERSPVIVVKPEDTPHLEKTFIYNYFYEWLDPAHPPLTSAVVLGHGLLFNHSVKPNAAFSADFKNETMVFTSLADIPMGQEICIDYSTYLWFENAE
jgi:SET domain-containing protein